MTLKSEIVGLAKATHFGPTVLVVSISFILSFTQLSFSKSIVIALAILAGQCVVGWTNDLIDQPRDSAADRQNKPLAIGSVTAKKLQVGIAISLPVAIVLSFLGPLGAKGGALHMLGLGSATAYNFGLKATLLSPIPYAISFGALPCAIYSAAHKNPPTWLFIDFILMSLAFHFLNVIKDLEWDRSQAVFGLPQRIGKACSMVTAALLTITSVLVFALNR